MQLFYNPEITQDTTIVLFSKEEAKHIIKVLRKAKGDFLYITNGFGWLFTAQLTKVDYKSLEAQILSKKLHPKSQYDLHLAVAPTKMNDRYEWFLEKATEIGISSITPIICKHSERRIIKHMRYQKIIQTAMKQSLRCHLPKLNPLISFNEFIKKNIKGKKYIAHCENLDKIRLKDDLKAKESVTILIGPEGDFSINEINTAIIQDYKPLLLSSHRLRTETAAITACQMVAFINT